MKVKVKATSKYQETNISDNELSVNGRVVPEEGKEWTTEKERAEMLQEKGFVTIVEEIKEVVEEKTKKTTKKKTTTKK
jgi:hypothetical protein